jgi:hypothetical protein
LREGSNKLGHRAGWQDEYRRQRQEINTIVDRTAHSEKKNTGRKCEN